MDIQKATELALKIYEELKPHCKRINIAGSIRRREAEVSDIEIIAIPKEEPLYLNTLFGKEEKTQISYGFVRAVEQIGVKIKGNPYGKYMQIGVNDVNIVVDLFLPDPDDYFRQYAIRTGPANYSQNVIAAGWRRLGWVGCDLGLRLYADCREYTGPDGKKTYTCERNKDKYPPVWKSEEDFFKWLNVPYKEPKERK